VNDGRGATAPAFDSSSESDVESYEAAHLVVGQLAPRLKTEVIKSSDEDIPFQQVCKSCL
jgi:hypothetical protein